MIPTIQLAAFDVDGTLTMDETYTGAVQAALQSLNRQNVITVVSTGRTLSETAQLRAHFPWIRYYILSNGACIWDNAQGVWMYEDLIPIDTARTVYRALEPLDMMTELYADGKACLSPHCMENPGHYNARFLYDNLPGSRTPVPDLWAFLCAREKGVEKVNMFFHNPEDLKCASACCSLPGLSLIVSLHQSLEANKAGSSKGKALKHLCEALQIDTARAAALGDGTGDISMFETVGWSMAMGNAPDEVKSRTHVVVPCCGEDGAAHAISHYLIREDVSL